MYDETIAEGFFRELHRYFPEWADTPGGQDTQRESDRNSYLAGGYADEFGYGAQPGGPPVIDPLEGDPESSRFWREQIGGLHPGYPQCPKPVDRYGLEASPDSSATRRSRSESPASVGYRVIPVGPRGRPPLLHLALRLGVISFLTERLIRRRHLNDVL
jgi:hypothetical protein